MTGAELAYMAGIVDGEGHISPLRYIRYRLADPVMRPYYRLVMGVSSIDKVLIDWIDERWPGQRYCARSSPNYMPCYRWWRHNNAVIETINDIYPYLIIKRPYADIAKRFQACMRFGEQPRSRLTDDEIQARATIYEDYIALVNSRRVRQRTVETVAGGHGKPHQLNPQEIN